MGMIEDRAENIVKILQGELADDSRTYTDRMISVMSRGRVFNDLLAEQGLRTHKMLEQMIKDQTA
mgnify:CR=1 FL=1